MPRDRDGIALNARSGWPALFRSAFRQSRNAMVLLDDRRRHVDVNGAYLKLLGLSRDDVLERPIYQFVVGGPVVSPEQWAAALAEEELTGKADLRSADGSTVTVQWGATTEVVTGHRLVLVVVLSASRWGHRFRREPVIEGDQAELTEREREVVGHVALGSTGPEIADELQIAHDTVRTHVRNAMTKVGARSRAHLVARALGDGRVLS